MAFAIKLNLSILNGHPDAISFKQGLQILKFLPNRRRRNVQFLTQGGNSNFRRSAQLLQ